MELQPCEICGKPFPPWGSWERFCLPCWKESKDYTLTKADKAFRRLQEAYEDLEFELDCLTRQSEKPFEIQLGPQDIKKLIKLCHPDKHRNSANATEMTKLLLSLRDKGKKKRSS